MLDMTDTTPRRCAIYTRKSTNHLLERDFNSLEAQRDICSAYISSQRHRGWREIAARYDDGGQSGTNFERPALSRLMQDIETRQVEVVVVYKIDRLTRSLADFVRLIEVFDRHDIALVSISQAFDTSDSMGRMILNILLTFSQFERELIADRVRDNVRARKRLGKWSGGPPPFGYCLEAGKLIVDEEEAATVRFLFKRFIEFGTYSALRGEVVRAGLRTKVKRTATGKSRGGNVLSRGHIYAILQNPIYVGEIKGHDGNYPGNHQPIIPRDLWEAASELSRRRAKTFSQAPADRFLSGLLWDSLGRRMILSIDHARGGPYFYYVSAQAGWALRDGIKAFRAHASRLEALVRATTASVIADVERLRDAFKGLGLERSEIDDLVARRYDAARRFADLSDEEIGLVLFALVRAIELSEEHMTLSFRTIELHRFLMWNGAPAFRAHERDWTWSAARYELRVPVRAISYERAPVIQVEARPASCNSPPRPELVQLLSEARKAQRLAEQHRERSLVELAKGFDCRPHHFARLLRLNYLAPDIVLAILDGTQPCELTRKMLLEIELPLDWALQREMLGFSGRRDRRATHARPH
jgi:DNA invertase Pin-like site-specific DNA recombinase